jgi:YggT family protein
MSPLLNFIAMVISLYIWVLIISAILSWLIVFDVVNRRNRAVYMIADTFHRMTEPALRPIRRALPDLGGLDISPVILILGLIFLRDVVIFGWLA